MAPQEAVSFSQAALPRPDTCGNCQPADRALGGSGAALRRTAGLEKGRFRAASIGKIVARHWPYPFLHSAPRALTAGGGRLFDDRAEMAIQTLDGDAMRHRRWSGLRLAVTWAAYRFREHKPLALYEALRRRHPAEGTSRHGVLTARGDDVLQEARDRAWSTSVDCP